VRGSVVKRVSKDGKRASYSIKYRAPDGRQRWETIGPNKKEAERALTERLNAIRTGTFADLKESSFEAFSIRWLAFKEPNLKASTFDGYARYFANHWVPKLGRYPLRAITAGQLQEIVAELQAQGLSGKSVNNFLVPLRKLFSDAVKWGYLAVNPAIGVERAKVSHQEMQALAPAQLRRLLAAVDPDYWLLFSVAVFTGLRRGELLALRWGDVDLDQAQLHVRRSVWRGAFQGPKTRRAIRTVDLAPSLVAALRAAKPLGPADEVRERLLFSGPNGRPLDPDNLVKRQFLPALERAELPRVRFHDLRHSYASLLIAAGQHPKYIQHQLGHASITTTLDRYGHLLPTAYSHGGQRLEETVLEGHVLPRS
jgi:integrase